MLTKSADGKWNKTVIERHLRSALDTLTPNVLERIDLAAPQEPAGGGARVSSFGRRMKPWAAAAACLCVVVLGGSVYTYRLNAKIDSVIGIDVNPSVELSINRKNKVLEADALNADAEAIMDDMNLEGVDLNVAVNAIIGSMVTHGYLDDLDNAILVTVSNDSVKKAANLREDVVGDIEDSLEENQVEAVVYDQQAVEDEAVKALAGEFGISYGKAYFLQELIAQNDALAMEDMNELAPLTMEEIARVISERSYALGEHTEKKKEPASSQEETTVQIVMETPAQTTGQEASSETAPTLEGTAGATTAAQSQPETTASATIPETTAEEIVAGKVKIDYVDYENGEINVYFVSKVRWRDATVSVKDGDGDTYSAMITDKDSISCVIQVPKLEGGKTYTFTIGGLSQSGGSKTTTVTGVFDAPEISENATESAPEETEEETLPPQTEQESSGHEETKTTAEGQTPSEQPDGNPMEGSEAESGDNEKKETETSPVEETKTTAAQDTSEPEGAAGGGTDLDSAKE